MRRSDKKRVHMTEKLARHAWERTFSSSTFKRLGVPVKRRRGEDFIPRWASWLQKKIPSGLTRLFDEVMLYAMRGLEHANAVEAVVQLTLSEDRVAALSALVGYEPTEEERADAARYAEDFVQKIDPSAMYGKIASGPAQQPTLVSTPEEMVALFSEFEEQS